MYSPFCLAELLCIETNALMQLSGESLALRWQLGVLLASAKSSNISLNKPKISISIIKCAEIHSAISSAHVYWRCKINLVKMRNVITPKHLLPVISPAKPLVSMVFNGTCWRPETVEKRAFGGLLWLIMRFISHSYCHSSSTVPFL